MVSVRPISLNPATCAWGAISLSLGLVLTGCGSDAPQLGEVAPAAFEHAAQADSVRIELSNVEFGEDLVESGYLVGASDGSTSQYQLSLGNGHEIEIIRVGESTYVRGNQSYIEDTFGTLGAQLIDDGQWLLGTDVKALDVPAILEPLLTAYAGAELEELGKARGESTQVDGITVYSYRGKEPEDDGDGRDESAEVSFTTNGLLKSVELRAEGEELAPQVLEFSQWNEVAEITAPASDEVAFASSVTDYP